MSLLDYPWNMVGKKVTNWECITVHVDDIKMAGKKQNSAPKWKKLMKEVDTEEPNIIS